jgi:hypothetical protein
MMTEVSFHASCIESIKRFKQYGHYHVVSALFGVAYLLYVLSKVRFDRS